MKYFKVCLAVICVLIISLVIGFWYVFSINKIAVLGLGVSQKNFYVIITQPRPNNNQDIPESAAPLAESAKFKLIEKIDFNKFLGEKYQDITERTYNEECGAGKVDAYDIVYGDLTGDRIEEAVVNYQTCLAGTSGGVSEVYMIDDKGGLREITPDLSEIPSPDKIFEGREGHDYYRINNTTLIYDFPVYNEGDANCCPTGGKITISFKWNGDKFVYDKHVLAPMIYEN